MRAKALALYVPPFRHEKGYIYDSVDNVVADDGKPQLAVPARVRGWGRIGYMENAAELQDEIGAILVEALNDFWAKHKEQK